MNLSTTMGKWNRKRELKLCHTKCLDLVIKKNSTLLKNRGDKSKQRPTIKSIKFDF
jgi:hypothetical protein